MMRDDRLLLAALIGPSLASLAWLVVAVTAAVAGLEGLSDEGPVTVRAGAVEEPDEVERSPRLAGRGACVVGQLLASEGPAIVDPELVHLEERLARPPFSAFSRFRFLASRRVPCGGDRAVMPLHGGGELRFGLAVDADPPPDGSAWDVEALDEDGRTLLRTRAHLRPRSPLFIVTSAGEGESLVIWVETA